MSHSFHQIEKKLSVPQEVIQILTAKSTKKETTKFSFKLATLLAWIDNDVEKQELTGLKIIGDNEIWIKKSALASTFQIQNDSLMINLKRNGFRLLKNVKDWAIYAAPANFCMISGSTKPCSIPKGKVVLGTDQSFSMHLCDKWKLITNGKQRTFVPIEDFFLRVIEVFEIKLLKKSDMFYLLSLVTFPKVPGQVSFTDFAQLYANFGEKNSIFPKMIALLKSAANGSWLSLESGDLPPTTSKETKVTFYDGPSFGFRVSYKDGTFKHIRNEFDVPFFSEYLVDDKGIHYSDWETILSHGTDECY